MHQDAKANIPPPIFSNLATSHAKGKRKRNEELFKRLVVEKVGYNQRRENRRKGFRWVREIMEIEEKIQKNLEERGKRREKS